MTEHRAGRPLLSVIAVAQGTSRPSGGLFILAEQHDSGVIPCTCGSRLLEPGEKESKFLGRQLQVVLRHWAGAQVASGTRFTPLDERTSTKGIANLSIDLDVVDRGRGAHKRIQNLLAVFLSDHGWIARNPDGEPFYDMGWVANGISWVAEVKSTTDANETQQLRLGLGQVLDYRARVQPGSRAALVIEREPSDLRWIDICQESGVTLCWPDDFEGLA